MKQQMAILADCMEYMRGCPDNSFDLAIADPPYGIGRDWMKRNKNKTRYQYSATTYTNACIPDKSYFDELRRVSKNYIIWGWNYYTDILGSTNYLIIWDKLSANNKACRYSKCEIACTNIHIPCNIVHLEWDGCRMGAERGTKKIHPHQKPIALYEWLLDNYAKPGDRILDTHLGSGSSRIAAYNRNHDFVGCEIDPYFFETQERRFEIYTKGGNQ